MTTNPYQPPNDDAQSPRDDRNLWPQSRRRRERMVYGTLRGWLWFGLRALVFVLIVAAIIVLSRLPAPNPQ